MRPNRPPPTVTETRTMTGCRFIARDCSMGERMLPSSCWTAQTMARTMRASVNPRETRATRTARAPAVTAPMMGMKPAMKVMTASVNAIGTPTMEMPRPMKTESTSETMACATMKPLSVFQARVSSSVAWSPVRPPVAERTHGRKRCPSLRKKKVSTRRTMSETMRLAAVPRPEKTPPAIAPAWFCIHWATSLIAWLRSSGSMLSGGPCSHSCMRWMPSRACR